MSFNKQDKLLFFGFEHDITVDVVPTLRKEGADITWISNLKEGYDVDIDFKALYSGNFEASSMPKNSETIYNKVYNKIIYFLNIQARKHEYTHEDNLFDMIDYFNIYFNYFMTLLKKNKFKAIVFSRGPHCGPSYNLYLIAKELGIKTIIFSFGAYFPGKTSYMFDIEEYGDLDVLPELSTTECKHIKRSSKQFIMDIPFELNKFVRKPNKMIYSIKEILKKLLKNNLSF